MTVNIHCYTILILLLLSSCSSFVPRFSQKASKPHIFGGKSISKSLYRATTDDGDDVNDANLNSDTSEEPPVSSFEAMVRSVTGKSNYRFGDLTKGAVSTTTHAFEDVAKKTNLVDKDYHFGVSKLCAVLLYVTS